MVIEIIYCDIMGYPIGYIVNGKTMLFIFENGKRKRFMEVIRNA